MSESPASRPPTGVDEATGAAGATTRRHRGAGGWSLWALPGRALAYVLALDLAALAVVVLAVSRDPGRQQDWWIVGMLFVGSVLHAEASRHIERIRISRIDKPFIDLKSMWTFAALLLADLGPTLVLTVVMFAYWWARNERRTLPHRWIFSWSTVVLGTAAAGLLLPDVNRDNLLTTVAGPGGLVLIATAACLRWAVNHGLVVGILLLVAPGATVRRNLASVSDTLLGLGALALGAALAVLAAASPWLVPILLVPVITLHRGVLVDQFRHAARTDTKTGLANGAAWAEVAAKELVRARRHDIEVAVLMVDLDEFKAVNDAHGHLVGDEVLRAVAGALSAGVRAYDAVGRFGGEEFVVLLSGVDPESAAVTAERLRARIGDIDISVTGPGGSVSRVRGLTASIGCAPCSGRPTTVDDLTAAADAALYEAKRAGRDRTVTAPPVP